MPITLDKGSRRHLVCLPDSETVQQRLDELMHECEKLRILLKVATELEAVGRQPSPSTRRHRKAVSR
jgi:hypothetical protein